MGADTVETDAFTRGNRMVHPTIGAGDGTRKGDPGLRTGPCARRNPGLKIDRGHPLKICGHHFHLLLFRKHLHESAPHRDLSPLRLALCRDGTGMRGASRESSYRREQVA
jgi:hypothetical protein